MSWVSRWEILQTLKGVFCMRRRAARLSMEGLKKMQTLSASLLRRPPASNCKVRAHGQRPSAGGGVMTLGLGHARESDHEMTQFKCCSVSAKSANNWSFKLVLKSVAKH